MPDTLTPAHSAPLTERPGRRVLPVHDHTDRQPMLSSKPRQTPEHPATRAAGRRT